MEGRGLRASAASPLTQGHPRGTGHAGDFAASSPRKWLTQRWRRALGMLQMVKQRYLMDSGCPDGSLGPVSSLSYFTPFSKILATCKGSPQKSLLRASNPRRPSEACVLLRCKSESETQTQRLGGFVFLGGENGAPNTTRKREMTLRRLFRDGSG